MAITLFYACKCGFSSGALEKAEQHAQTTSHVVNITGTLTPKITLDVEAISASAAEKARDSAVLRAARDRGLLKEGRRS
jgi:hypothetical protein